MTYVIARVVETATGNVVVATRDETGYRRAEGVTTMSGLLSLPTAEIRSILDSSRDGVHISVEHQNLPPIDGACEVWAAGVTYERSREARVEESDVEDVYDRVYVAARPELFFKGAAWRTVTDNDPIAIRADSPNNTSEPELGLVVNAHAEIIGYVIVNDMSSRSIEGENPLYLPQAKIYDGSCSMSPTVVLAWHMPDPENLTIRIEVRRGTIIVFEEKASTSLLQRSFTELVESLFHSNTFPAGVVLSTGTCLVPPMSSTTLEGDIVTISVDGLGTLTNKVHSVTGIGEWLWHRRTEPLAKPPNLP